MSLRIIVSALFLFSLFSVRTFSDETNKALVIIDMQPYFVTRDGFDKTSENQEKVKQLIQAQVEAIQKAKEAQLPIMFIEYSGDGKTNEVLRKSAENYKNVVFFLKDTDGMLDKRNSHQSELVQFLNKNRIQTLIILGANGGACVLKSIEGALENGYNVVAYPKGIADFNYQEFIYPYEGHYDKIKASTKLPNKVCTFRQVNDLNVIFVPSKEERQNMQECSNRVELQDEKKIKELQEQICVPLEKSSNKPSVNQRGRR